jgi:Zn-finger nucleic acid-binding protein
MLAIAGGFRMKCLNCRTEMTNNTVATKKDRLSYDMCEKCGSLWLDSGELDKLAFQVEGSIEFCEEDKDAEPETPPKKCPRCDDSVLEKVKFLESDDIFLHHCKNCGGFWLDGGELNLIDKELAKIMPVKGKGFSDFVNDVHVPYWSKRVKKQSSETNFHVDVMPINGAELVKGTTDICPACGNALNLYSIAAMEFEGCPKCKGVWLVKDELRKLKNKEENSSLRWMNDEIENMEKTSVVATNRACVKCKTVKMVSVIFGKSSILIDWCPQCHGMWLDRDEFDAITEYLKLEKMRLRTKEIEKELVTDVKRVVTGGPESRLDELLDAKSAVHALVNATIFEHPALFKFITSIPRYI